MLRDLAAPRHVEPDPAHVAAHLQALLHELERRPPVVGSESVAAVHRGGAANLADYLALRGHDLRDLQESLARLGLSSLGRSEAHVHATLLSTHRACVALAGRPVLLPELADFDAGVRALATNTEALLGPGPPHRQVRIMVTLPTAAAEDGGETIDALLAAGMDCARINTAHDDPETWARMLARVRSGAGRAGRPCTVLADLSGPKLRTGPIVEGARARRIRPEKDDLGRVIAPAVVLLVREGEAPPPHVGTAVPVTGPLVDDLVTGDEVTLVDARGKGRSLQIGAVGDGWAVAGIDRTTWVQTGTELRRASAGAAPATSRCSASGPWPCSRSPAWRRRSSVTSSTRSASSSPRRCCPRPGSSCAATTTPETSS